MSQQMLVQNPDGGGPGSSVVCLGPTQMTVADAFRPNGMSWWEKRRLQRVQQDTLVRVAQTIGDAVVDVIGKKAAIEATTLLAAASDHAKAEITRSRRKVVLQNAWECAQSIRENAQAYGRNVSEIAGDGLPPSIGPTVMESLEKGFLLAHQLLEQTFTIDLGRSLP